MSSEEAEQAREIRSILILGTGLIGTSVALGLRAGGFVGAVAGWDPKPRELADAVTMGALDGIDDPLQAARVADLILLAGPVFAIADWLERLAPVLQPHQLVTDVGSVKQFLCRRAGSSYNAPGKPGYLPGHPMAGREVSGAANADAKLFDGAVWLFTPVADAGHPLAPEWRGWVREMGARALNLAPDRHDLLCAWISHLPQLLATALASMLEERFAGDAALHQIGGRALREMTRLGQSPYSMWRDIAHTNQPEIAAALLALEQQLTHLRDNLKTPELRSAFEQANAFRATLPPQR